MKLVPICNSKLTSFLPALHSVVRTGQGLPTEIGLLTDLIFLGIGKLAFSLFSENKCTVTENRTGSAADRNFANINGYQSTIPSEIGSLTKIQRLYACEQYIECFVPILFSKYFFSPFVALTLF
jgi:hypothetical protein